MRITV
ncbi:Protein of unknown function [Weissella confusa LBAE C39-2]